MVLLESFKLEEIIEEKKRDLEEKYNIKIDLTKDESRKFPAYQSSEPVNIDGEKVYIRIEFSFESLNFYTIPAESAPKDPTKMTDSIVEGVLKSKKEGKENNTKAF